jgi:hypothetical protein
VAPLRQVEDLGGFDSIHKSALAKGPSMPQRDQQQTPPENSWPVAPASDSDGSCGHGSMPGLATQHDDASDLRPAAGTDPAGSRGDTESIGPLTASAIAHGGRVIEQASKQPAGRRPLSRIWALCVCCLLRLIAGGDLDGEVSKHKQRLSRHCGTPPCEVARTPGAIEKNKSIAATVLARPTPKHDVCWVSNKKS